MPGINSTQALHATGSDDNYADARKSVIRIRPATRDDIEAFHGKEEGRTVRAFAVEKDGKLAAIAGITRGIGHYFGFSIIAPDVQASPRQVLNTAREVLEKMKGFNIPFYVIAEPTFESSERFLQVLGFIYLKQTDDGVVYRLATQE